MPWAAANSGLGGLADMMNSKAKPTSAADMKLKPESDKLSADCYNNIAACMLQQENPNYGRIVSHCESSLALSPNNLKATYRKGVAQYYLRDYDSSMDTLKSARGLPNGDKDKNITMYMSMCKKELETQENELKGIYRTMLGADK
ncbi:tetratricopeptide repeat protein 9C-like isoform X2 [Lineus longissimus]